MVRHETPGTGHKRGQHVWMRNLGGEGDEERTREENRKNENKTMEEV